MSSAHPTTQKELTAAALFTRMADAVDVAEKESS